MPQMSFCLVGEHANVAKSATYPALTFII